MRTCVHGTPVGTYCTACQGPVRPKRIELDFNHYMNAPPSHNVDTCATCTKVRDYVASQKRDN